MSNPNIAAFRGLVTPSVSIPGATAVGLIGGGAAAPPPPPPEEDFMLALATTDVSRANDSTETADPDLVLAVDSGVYYAVESMLIFTSSSATPDVSVELGGPFTVNLDFGASGLIGIAQFTSLASLAEFKAESAGLDFGQSIPAGEFTIIRFWGFVLTNAAGNLSVAWGQRTSDAAATVRKAGSWFRVGAATP